MLYRISVQIRVIAVGDHWYSNMTEVVTCGKLRELGRIGFYLLASKEAPSTDDEIRGHSPMAISGTVVVEAGDIYEAQSRFYRHPGVVGTGRERPDKKAVWMQEPGVSIWENPSCDLAGDIEECFSINKDGWAICKYVQNDPINREHGYCHCVLQNVDEPPTGCSVEAYLGRVDGRRDKVACTVAVRYMTLDPTQVIE